MNGSIILYFVYTFIHSIYHANPTLKYHFCRATSLLDFSYDLIHSPCKVLDIRLVQAAD